MPTVDYTLTPIRNGEPVSFSSIASLSIDDYSETLKLAVRQGWRVVAFSGMKNFAQTPIRLFAVLAKDADKKLAALVCPLDKEAFASLTPEIPQFHLFERELTEQFGVHVDGHPWMKPVRFSRPAYARTSGDGQGASSTIGITDFYRVEGDEVHEVAVGPVHAGVIEPGHFRFQCHGERVFHLEISLGYQHRGVEEALLGGPHTITPYQMETVAGDSSVAHAWSYLQNVEGLSRVEVSDHGNRLRAVALELERLANHTGDLGALAGDVGFLPTMSYCGHIRGDFLNMTALLCGNRFGRGMLRIGGVRFSPDERVLAQLQKQLDRAEKDVTSAVELLWKTNSVVSRFENTGYVAREQAVELGLVGPAARACGIEIDSRADHPTGFYGHKAMPVAVAHHGDVHSRAYVRWLEIRNSIQFIRETIASMPEAKVSEAPGPLMPDAFVVSIIEGWRGEVTHVAITDSQGRFARYKIIDPSFHNWIGLAMAMRNGQISDFPLCNKSFNLSYCGHDL